MFANPLWSILILAALLAVYVFIIRPRLKVAFSQTYLNIDSWWERQLTRLWQFRSWAAVVLWGVVTSFPDLAVAVLPIDMSWLFGEHYAKVTTGVLTAFLAINSAMKTKPDGQQA